MLKDPFSGPQTSVSSPPLSSLHLDSDEYRAQAAAVSSNPRFRLLKGGGRGAEHNYNYVMTFFSIIDNLVMILLLKLPG